MSFVDFLRFNWDFDGHNNPRPRVPGVAVPPRRQRNNVRPNNRGPRRVFNRHPEIRRVAVPHNLRNRFPAARRRPVGDAAVAAPMPQSNDSTGLEDSDTAGDRAEGSTVQGKSLNLFMIPKTN